MKGDIRDTSLHFGTMELGVFSLFLGALILLLLFTQKRSSDSHDVLRALTSNPSIVVEPAGETSTEHLFSLSISTLAPTFDLNMIYSRLRGTGCRVMSTADSAHPSFRKLTIAVPKTAPSSCGVFGSSSIVVALGGIIMGVCMFLIPDLYNYFDPWILEIHELIQTQTQTFI